MNKIAFFFLVTIFFSSCRKDRECICKKLDNPDNRETYPISVSKKKDAEQQCQEYYETYKLWYESCKLE